MRRAIRRAWPGMLIAAAVHMGFKYKTYVDDLGYDLPNVNFNMSKRSIDELDFEIRPSTDWTHDRVRRRQSKTTGEAFASMIPSGIAHHATGYSGTR